MPCPTLRRRTGRAALIAVAGFVLVACGGGSGASSDAPATAAGLPALPLPLPAPTPDPLPAPAPEPVPPAAGSRATCDLPDFEAEALRLVNAARAAGASCGSQGDFAATTALAWDAALTQAALVHSEDMVAGNFFSHTGSDDSSAGARATAAGYVWRTWGENIAAGQPTVASVVAAWLDSPGHCANLMRPAFQDIGLACVSGGAGNRYRSYWTMVLAAPR